MKLSNDGSLYTEASLLDLYASRNVLENDFPGISKCNFIECASNYCQSKTGIRKRPFPVVIKTYPNYSSSPKGPSYGLFCKYQLLRYKPWQHSIDNAWGNKEGTDSIYIEQWHAFLETPKARQVVPNWLQQIDSISEYVIIDRNGCPEIDTGEREEWMILADLKFQCDAEINDKDIHSETEHYLDDKSKYTLEQIGNMPHWINEKKNAAIPELDDRPGPIIELTKMNENQAAAFNIIRNHYLNASNNQLLMMITGLGRSGKSFVIEAVRNLLTEKCRVCAFFGIAAFNIKGTTLHSLLQLPIQGKRNGPLKSSALAKLQNDLNGITYLITDEFSVIGQKMFAWINRRCKQATGHFTLPFGGLSIILVGDIGQLPSIADQVIYHTRPKSDLALEGYCMYRKLETVIKFEVNERAKGANHAQQQFRDLQVRARDGNSNLEDWKLLLSRAPHSVDNISHFQESAVRLSFGNKKVAKDNLIRLKQLGENILEIKAIYNNPTAKKLSAEEMGGLEPTIYLSKRARVMLKRNLWTKAGLCNGAMGIVRHIILPENHTPSMLPIAIIVQFDDDDYIGPSFCKDLPNCVPIYPVTSFSTNGLERQQFPLKHAWSITIHKSQGLTLKNCWIDLGPSEKVAGLTYVAVSRVRKLSNLVIEPMSFDRLHSIKKTSNYKYSLLEETRLNTLAQKTLQNYRNELQ